MLALLPFFACTPAPEPPDTADSGFAGCPADALTLDDERGRHVVDHVWRWDPSQLLAHDGVVFVDVPADVDSLHLTVDAGAHDATVAVHVDGALHSPAALRSRPAVSLQWPFAPGTAPPPGCWAIRPAADTASADGEAGRTVIHWRRGGAVLEHLPLVVGRSSQVTLADDAVEGLIERASTALRTEAGLRPELLAIVDLPDDDGVLLVERELQAWLRRPADLDLPDAQWVHLVPRFDNLAILGAATGVPGAVAPGTSGSGVVMAVDPFTEDGSTDLEGLAEVLGHELGHHLGLFHPTEADASAHDPLPDTPECEDADRSGRLDPEECPQMAGNLMFWLADGVPEFELTPDQIAVLRASTALQSGTAAARGSR
ncbi:MAG: hypothetical protein KTR31_08015 [Myxococcales bacterium]|nr:hypothetical protein [Myxococcales bacterium]